MVEKGFVLEYKNKQGRENKACRRKRTKRRGGEEREYGKNEKKKKYGT